jgi:tRNA A-37 threonylcarbamoyl transferase component Bud32
MNPNNYGFSFNDILIKNEIFIKKAKNEYGSIKIKKEIAFYNTIQHLQIPFPIPTIYTLDSSNALIEMQYIHSTTLTKVFNKELHLPIVLNHLNQLHNFYTKHVSKQEYTFHLMIETKDKIINRYNQTDWFIINDIKSVNGIQIKDIYFYLDKINTRIQTIIEKMNSYTFHYIHGDVHLGNMLVDCSNNIFFIDPRGYYGEQELIGIKEYDYAKLLFGLSGYSIFDEMTIDSFHMENNDLQIDFLHTDIYKDNTFDEFTKLISLTIWLGNNSNFIDTNKKKMSLMISFYLCELYL